MSTQALGERLWRFHGGIKLRHWKKLSIGKTLEFAGIPPILILPLSQHIGEAAEAIVEVGQPVSRGQRIANAISECSAHLHAPTSGQIIAIEPRSVVHPSNLHAPCIVLKPDRQDSGTYSNAVLDWEQTSAETLLTRIQDAGIVGLGGAACPTSFKVGRAQQHEIDLLLINGAECEPYIACDESLMRHHSLEFLRGCQIVSRAVSAAETVVAVEDQMGVTEHLLNATLQQHDITDIKVIKVPTIYPEGGEDQLIKALTNREVPAGGTPLDLGILCQNVGTAKAVYDAIVDGRPLISRIVSITGRGIQEPCNVEALIGTPIDYLVNHAGGYRDDIARLLVGGPMMGVAVASDDRPLTKACNCVLGLTTQDTQLDAPELPCIRCMECVRVCPAQLLPQQLMWAIKADDFDQAQQHALTECIECGCCAYACPSQIPLVDYYRYGKAQLESRQEQRQQSDHARQRYEDREQRLVKEEQARKARLDARRLATDQDQKQDHIAAAIARAKARKESAAATENSHSTSPDDNSGVSS